MLTREEIQALQPGHETDVAVAVDVMGWKVDPEESKRCNVAVVEWVEDGQQVWRWFKPSTDISAAMEAEKVSLENGHPRLCRYIRNLSDVVGMEMDSLVGISRMVHATPEQRCKAALIALMEGQAHDL